MNHFLDKTSRATVFLARMALSFAIIGWAAVGIQDSVSHLFRRKKKVVVYVEKSKPATHEEKQPKVDESKEDKPKVDEPKVEIKEEEVKEESIESPFVIKDPLRKPESHLPKNNKPASETKKTTK